MQVEETGISVPTGRRAVWCLWMEAGEERRAAFDHAEIELQPPAQRLPGR